MIDEIKLIKCAYKNVKAEHSTNKRLYIQLIKYILLFLFIAVLFGFIIYGMTRDLGGYHG